MKSLKQIIEDKKPVDKNKFISREFQDYGYRLSEELNDQKHKSLYIKLAKTVERGILEGARQFVVDSNAYNKGALFMWKVKELRKKAQGGS